MIEQKKKAVFDVETFRNYFCVSFKCVETRRVKTFELFESHPLDTAGIIKILRNYCVVGFNSNNYDIPILLLALRQGVTNLTLKNASDAIIVGGKRPWELRDQYNIPKIDWLDHIDLIEVAPGQASLKLYGGRLHSKRMQDLPVHHDALITPDQRPMIVDYNVNDLDTTIDLLNDLSGELELRYSMSETYGLDLRSKSDAQIAEAVIVKQIEEKIGDKIYRPEYANSFKFSYDPPDFIRFNDPDLNSFFDDVKNAKYGFSEKDKVTIPDELKGRKVNIAGKMYQFGNGGLHSTESRVANISDNDSVVIDSDVASYYPSIVLECGLSPEQLGEHFFSVYSGIKVKRLEAKKRKDKVMDSGLKIFLNGSFGKLGSKWSKLYAPKLMIQVTVTGQLALLMLIEEFESCGIPVISANTDGVVCKCPRDMQGEMARIIAWWENTTKFKMESNIYKALYSRDVNNYIAIKDGEDAVYDPSVDTYVPQKAYVGVKQKGAYAFAGSKGKSIEKNPSTYVCIDAAINYLMKGVPLEETIEWCTDIRRFLKIRRVDGGAVYDGEPLGKAVRWYYSRNSKGYIEYAKNGNKVAESDGAVPLMELPDRMPTDIDWDWYYREARSILREIGADYEYEL